MAVRNLFKMCLSVFIAASSSPSFAQDDLSYGYANLADMHMNNAMSMAVTQGIQASIYNDELYRKSQVSTDVDQAGLVAASFKYMPSEARTRANLAQFVTKTRAADPAGADQLQAMFASTDIIGAVGAEMQKVGLRPDDVADAYAVWWVTAWYAVQGRESVSDRDTFAAVREQAVRAFEATGKFDDASDAVRQEMAESLMVQAAMVDGANDHMRGDADQRRALAAAVNKGARAMGLDLTSMTLTSEGFRPRKGSDYGPAIKAVEGEEPRALATASPTDAPPAAANDDSAANALLAAAGGAGLVVMFMAGRASGRKG